MRSHDKRFDNLPEDIRVNKASEDAGFMRKISLVQYFMTIHDMDLTEFVRHPEVMKDPHQRMDSRKHENWLSIRSRGYVSLVSIWN